jgi:AraC-like DNA-binding protein
MLAILRHAGQPADERGAMRSYALTKTRSMGPVADMVERAGGSLARVFRRADLPMRSIEDPDRLVLLGDQLALVEAAAREIGDDALAARLSTEAGFTSLGSFGRQVQSMPDLAAAIGCANRAIGPLLQSSTEFGLCVSHGLARWTYRVTDAVELGRQKNEMLALGYMLDLVRHFAGRRFTPTGLALGGPRIAAKSAAEIVYGAELFHADTAAIVFPAGLLEAQNPRALESLSVGRAELPDPSDLVACTEALIGLALLGRRPGIDWLARHLGTSRRSLQRRLAARGTSFETLLARVSIARACDLLRSGAEATEVGLELGYADPAHFSRAFRRWTGSSPRAWQRTAAMTPRVEWELATVMAGAADPSR